MPRPSLKQVVVSALATGAVLFGLPSAMQSASAAVPLPAFIQLELAPSTNGGTPPGSCADAYYRTPRMTACATDKVHNWFTEKTAAGTVRLRPGNNRGYCLTVVAGAPQIGGCDSASSWQIVASGRSDGAFLVKSSTGGYLANGSGTGLLTLSPTGSEWLGAPPASHSRYVRNIRPGADNAAVLKGEGCADATRDTGAGSSLPRAELLHIGAQTITAPLSAQNPGVALTGVSPTVRLSYSELVTAVDGYLDGYTSCFGGAGVTTIVVATNNDGAWDGPYTDAQRGTDWAEKVVAPLRSYEAGHAAPTGTASKPVVAGGFDVEAGFASSEAQAENWISAYLANTDANLVTVGSLDACPQTSGSTTCGAVVDDNDVTKHWTLHDYERLNGALSPGRISVMPEIYFVSQARQWAVLEQQSVADGTGHLPIRAVLTEFAADSTTLAPTQAVTALTALLPSSDPAPLSAVSDLASDQ